MYSISIAINSGNMGKWGELELITMSCPLLHSVHCYLTNRPLKNN